ncbi:MAG: DUF2971 domain-containing protein [Acidobacteriota bacterium]|nr:DUF2971 domain-containing protein [Acidobacteriota bacterium]
MNPPTVLYKYLSPARIDVLLNKHLRFTQACALNDPFEFSPGAPVPDAEGLGHFEARLAKSRETQCLENSRTFGVLSLAQENNSIPMWTHYASTHSGFAIGFDAESGWLGQAIRQQKLDRVRYIRERICSTRLSPDHPELKLDDIFMTKSAEWEYEQEWRWIERGNPGDYANVVSGLAGELLFLRSFPPESVREIILGCRSSSALIESVQTIALTPDFTHVRLLKVVLDESKYLLNVGKL